MLAAAYQNSGPVPFRASPLTKLLMDCVGDDGTCVLLVRGGNGWDTLLQLHYARGRRKPPTLPWAVTLFSVLRRRPRLSLPCQLVPGHYIFSSPSPCAQAHTPPLFPTMGEGVAALKVVNVIKKRTTHLDDPGSTPRRLKVRFVKSNSCIV